MLKIINDLRLFFEDCYRRISVREYARIMHVSPPTASSLLESYYKEGLLMRNRERNYIFFYANKENKNFIDISRIYWRYRLKDIILYIENETIDVSILLFGSLSKAEVTADSDIDLAVIGHKKQLQIKEFEDKIKRKIQIFWFNSISDIKSTELANNIVNGYILTGKLVV